MNPFIRAIGIGISLVVLTGLCVVQDANYGAELRLNQVGFYPHAPKIAVVTRSLGGSFALFSLETQQSVFEGRLSEEEFWSYSGEKVRRADFSSFRQPGRYLLAIPGQARSEPIEIKANVYEGVHQALLKSYYFQRASMPLESAYAGAWARPAGHPDHQVYVHESAASPGRPAGSRIAAPRGWYDAGDYGKYVPTTTYSAWMLLDLYEQNPQFYQYQDLGLPESSNSIPDLLDEVLWTLRWLMAMQEPEEGFVYHKLTTSHHARKIMPEQDRDRRYVVGKSTAATLGFAAVMARAARILKPFEGSLPGLPDSCLLAAHKAWTWGLAHPQVAFMKNPMDIRTGVCKDDYFADEKQWAAVELSLTTGDLSYITLIDWATVKFPNPPSRKDVSALACLTILRHPEFFPELGGKGSALRWKFFKLVNRFVKHAREESAYRVPLGRRELDFLWGSNGIHASMGMCLVGAYQLSGKAEYREVALSVADYLLGRNATGYCFVTGFGYRSPQHIHHRPSAADRVDDPIPGFLVGGPQNELNRDRCTYPDSLPATTYLDDWCSYTTNEVAINWNAPACYLFGSLEAMQN